MKKKYRTKKQAKILKYIKGLKFITAINIQILKFRINNK